MTESVDLLFVLDGKLMEIGLLQYIPLTCVMLSICVICIAVVLKTLLLLYTQNKYVYSLNYFQLEPMLQSWFVRQLKKYLIG